MRAFIMQWCCCKAQSISVTFVDGVTLNILIKP